MKLFSRKPRNTGPSPDWLLNAGIALFRTLRPVFGLFIVAIPIQMALQIHGKGVSELMTYLTFVGALLVLVISYFEGNCVATKEKQDKAAAREAAMEDAKALEEWKQEQFKQ